MKNQTDNAIDDAHLELLETMARFVKARFLYPSNNTRVAEARTTVASRLQKLQSQITDSAVVLRLNGTVFFVADEEIEEETPNIDWLRDALLKCSVGRLEFAPGVSEDSLDDFAGKLRKSLGRTGSGFDEHWNEPIQGIEISDLRLCGRHGEIQEGDWDLPPDDSEVQRDAMVSHLLMRDESVANKLGDIRQVLEKSVSGDIAEHASLDLLEPICRALPDEAFRDPASMCDLVSQALSECIPRMLTLLDRGETDEQEAMEMLTVEVSQHFFARGKDELAGVDLSGFPEGRPEDEGITDDLQMMFAEYEQLPSRTIQLEDDPTVRAKETIGILLHYLVTGENASIRSLVSAELAQLLEAHPDQVEMVRSYVLASVYGTRRKDEASNENLWRVLDFAHERGYAGEVANSALDVRVLRRSFPNLFAAFLDRLEPHDRASERELNTALRAIGIERMAESADFLVADGGLVDRRRLSIALGTGSEVMAPAVQSLAHIETDWVRFEVIAYLRRRQIPEDIATALRVVRPISDLTPEYLAALAAPRIEEDDRQWLAAEAGRLVRTYLEKTRGNDDVIEYRQRAARQLGCLPCEENVFALQELVREIGLRITSRQRWAFRRIVKETLGRMKQKLARRTCKS